MKKLCLLGLIAAGFILAGCSSYTVQIDYDDSADFDSYSTFGWMPKKHADRPQARSLLDARIQEAVKNELEARGLRFVNHKPEVLINYHFGMRNKIDVDVYGYGWRRPPKRVVRHYKEGTLVLDFIDPINKQLVWRGWASGIVGPPHEAEKNVYSAVESIIDKYPPEY
jgi:hypothetical protein